MPALDPLLRLLPHTDVLAHARPAAAEFLLEDIAEQIFKIRFAYVHIPLEFSEKLMLHPLYSETVELALPEHSVDAEIAEITEIAVHIADRRVLLQF